MRRATICAAALAMAELLGGRLGRAEAPGTVRLGLDLVPTPAGILSSRTQGTETTVGSVFAFGVMATADVDLHPHLFAGVGVNQTFHVRARGTSGDANNQLDLLLRVGAIIGIADGARLYGYLAPGYSFVGDTEQHPSARGPVVGVHAGAMFDATPRLYLAAELGYQQGFQQATIDGVTDRFSASFIQVGLGVGVRL
jgi:hypothetical protein